MGDGRFHLKDEKESKKLMKPIQQQKGDSELPGVAVLIERLTKRIETLEMLYRQDHNLLIEKCVEIEELLRGGDE